MPIPNRYTMTNRLRMSSWRSSLRCDFSRRPLATCRGWRGPLMRSKLRVGSFTIGPIVAADGGAHCATTGLMPSGCRARERISDAKGAPWRTTLASWRIRDTGCSEWTQSYPSSIAVSVGRGATSGPIICRWGADLPPHRGSRHCAASGARCTQCNVVDLQVS